MSVILADAVATYYGAQNDSCDVATFGSDHLTYAQALTGNYPIGQETLYKLDICENGYRHLHLDTYVHLFNLAMGSGALISFAALGLVLFMRIFER